MPCAPYSMPLGELLNMPGCAGAATAISGIELDSRNVSVGDLFLAMPGEKKVVVTTEKDATRLEPHREWLIEKQIPLLVVPIEVYFHFDGKEKFEEAVKEFLMGFRV